MNATWDFSLANAIFSTALLVGLAMVHWYKMAKFRTNVEGRIESLMAQLAPVPQALAQLSSGFLGDRLQELENRVDEVQARVVHIETMLEQSHSPPPGGLAREP